MNGQGRQTGSIGDELTTWAMIALIGVFAITTMLHLAGIITAFLTGNPQPSGGIASGVGVLFHPGDPAAALGASGLNPVIYWIHRTPARRTRSGWVLGVGARAPAHPPVEGRPAPAARRRLHCARLPVR